MKRDPSKEPRVGDKWKSKNWNFKWILTRCNIESNRYWCKYIDEISEEHLCNLSEVNEWSRIGEFLGNDKEKEEMNTRDPIINPQAGDYWERTSWKQIVVFSENNRVILLEKRSDGLEAVWDTSLDQFKVTFKGIDYKFIGNHPEKMSEFKPLNGVKMNNATLTTTIILGKEFKENLIERERAITDPQAGDRWIWGDGVSIEVYAITPPQYGQEGNNVCYASSVRETNSKQIRAWRAFLHAATFVGNFTSKTEKRDPKKNPQSGDKWEVARHYNNWMYNGSYKEIAAGSILIIDSVTQRGDDVYIYGYFTNGVKFICPMKEFEARTQSFKFVE